MHIGPPMRIVSDGPSMYAPQLSCSTKSPTTMNDISIARLRELLATPEYQTGAVLSEEEEGTFAGPIENIELRESGIKMMVSPLLRRVGRDWAIDTTRGNPMCQAAHDALLGLRMDGNGIIHFRLQMIGEFEILPNSHPAAESILAFRPETTPSS